MHKVKTQKSGELFVKNMLIFKFFSMVTIKNYKVKKKLFNKFLEISRNFPREISKLTTLAEGNSIQNTNAEQDMIPVSLQPVHA